MKSKLNKSVSNRTKEMFDNIVSKLQKIVENGDYKKFLKFQKNFKGYSFNNLILIFSQFPDATQVAGKSKWLKLNRQLINGAKKIWIVAPIPRKYDKKVKKIKDGEEIEEMETIQYNAYRYVFVYDISQTLGKEIPLQSRTLNSNDMFDFYEKLKSFSEIPIIEKEIFGGAEGYYNPSQKNIVIKNNLSIDDKTAVLLHELAHAMYDDFDLDTSKCSFNYIIKWANGDTKTVIELGNKIQKCANEFIDKIENYEFQKIKLVA